MGLSLLQCGDRLQKSESDIHRRQILTLTKYSKHFESNLKIVQEHVKIQILIKYA